MYFSWYSTKILLSTLLTISLANPVSGTGTIPSPLIQRKLTSEDLIVAYHGRVEVMSRKKYVAHVKDSPIVTVKQQDNNFTTVQDEESIPTIEKRCQTQTVFTFNPVETIMGWDVAMSSVVSAPPNQTATVHIDKGHIVGEKLSVSLGQRLELVKIFMDASFGLNYEKSWVTDDSVKYTFIIPPGKFGAVVSNPITTRHSGWVDIGCVGKTQRTKFTGDSYKNMMVMQMPWVEGVIGLCVGDSFPLRKCFGDGYL